MFAKRFPSDLGWLRRLPEVPTVFLFFALAISETITYNFSMYRACYVNFGYDKADCERLSSTDNDEIISSIQDNVMPFVTQVLTVQELIVQVIPAVLGLFVGPWSDKNGRRPVMRTAMFGMVVGGASAFAIIFTNSSLWWFLLPTLPMALFGGIVPFLTACYCYVVDITTEANRGLRMGVFEGFMASGTLIGTFVTSYIFAVGGYVPIYVIVFLSFLLAFLYNVFGLVESLKVEKKQRLTLKVFSPNHIVDLVKVTFKRRENNATVIVLLLILMGIVTRFGTNGTGTVTYMFLTGTMNWDLEHYTIYRTLREIVTILATVFGVYVLHKRLRIREAPLILLSSVFLVTGAIITGFATEDWHIYLGGLMTALSGIAGAMNRTLISKLVENHETGKVFALLTAIQSVSLLGGLPLYMQIYNNTITTNPGGFNFLTAGLYALMFIITVIILVIQKVSLKQDLLRMDKEESSDEKADTKVPELSADNSLN